MGGVKEGGGGAKKKERGAKREHRAHSVFWLQRNPSGTRKGGGGRGVQGGRGGVDTSEQSRKLAEERNMEEGKRASLR